jgi:hypothetical protein
LRADFFRKRRSLWRTHLTPRMAQLKGWAFCVWRSFG